jgi:ribonuclease HI
LNYFCTNNQVEYEALLFGLEILQSMEVKRVEALFSDFLLVIQQIAGVFSVWKNHLMHVVVNALTSLHILSNSKFGIF